MHPMDTMDTIADSENEQYPMDIKMIILNEQYAMDIKMIS